MVDKTNTQIVGVPIHKHENVLLESLNFVTGDGRKNRVRYRTKNLAPLSSGTDCEIEKCPLLKFIKSIYEG